MVTTEFKDKVLSYIIEHQKNLRILVNSQYMEREFGMTSPYIVAVIQDLQHRNLLKIYERSGYRHECYLTIRLFDFHKHGGYAFEEKVANTELQKLKLEVESLAEAIPKSKYDVMMTAINVILSSFQAFK